MRVTGEACEHRRAQNPVRERKVHGSAVELRVDVVVGRVCRCMHVVGTGVSHRAHEKRREKQRGPGQHSCSNAIAAATILATHVMMCLLWLE